MCVFVCKEGCCVGLGQEGGFLRKDGGTVWNTINVGGIGKSEGKQKF